MISASIWSMSKELGQRRLSTCWSIDEKIVILGAYFFGVILAKTVK